MRLREGAQDEDVATAANVVDGLRILEFTRMGEVVGVIVIGLVNHYGDVFGHNGQEAIQRRSIERGSGGVVGISEKYNGGCVIDRVGESVQVETVVSHGRLDQMSA